MSSLQKKEKTVLDRNRKTENGHRTKFLKRRDGRTGLFLFSVRVRCERGESFVLPRQILCAAAEFSRRYYVLRALGAVDVPTAV